MNKDLAVTDHTSIIDSAEFISPTPLRIDIAVVIVLYKCSIAESESIQSLHRAAQKAGTPLRTFVYDNSPHPISDSWVTHYPFFHITYLHNPDNSGLSIAYQECVQRASREGITWMVFADQDTTFHENILSVYREQIEKYPDMQMLVPRLWAADVIVSPCRYWYVIGRGVQQVDDGPRDLRGWSVLNSGMCVRIHAYLSVGGHNPEVRLDFSDHEFIRRFAQRFRRCVVVNADCRHGLFSTEVHTVADQLVRFRLYCEGARAAFHGGFRQMLIYLIMQGRAVLLSCRYREMRFLMVPTTVFLNTR
jgi:rhamnosyltransferase